MKAHRNVLPLFCACLACGLPAVLAGCGGCGGSPAGPGQSRLAGTDTSPSAYDALEYRWWLPASDTGATGNDGHAYALLRRDCDEGAAYLASTNGKGFRSPRNAVLFAAGIQLCRGELQTARQHFDHARTVYGLAGLAPESRAECDLYKSIRSVLEQIPRATFPCPEGQAPAYRTTEDGRIDNPLTPGTDETRTPDPASTPDPLPVPSPVPGPSPVPPPHLMPAPAATR